jgi:hypothetical protein
MEDTHVLSLPKYFFNSIGALLKTLKIRAAELENPPKLCQPLGKYLRVLRTRVAGGQRLYFFMSL